MHEQTRAAAECSTRNGPTLEQLEHPLRGALLDSARAKDRGAGDPFTIVQ